MYVPTHLTVSLGKALLFSITLQKKNPRQAKVVDREPSVWLWNLLKFRTTLEVMNKFIHHDFTFRQRNGSYSWYLVLQLQSSSIFMSLMEFGEEQDL